MEKNYIVLWADEMDAEAWADYCKNFGVPRDASCIKIHFNDEDLEYEEEEEEE